LRTLASGRGSFVKMASVIVPDGYQVAVDSEGLVIIENGRIMCVNVAGGLMLLLNVHS